MKKKNLIRFASVILLVCLLCLPASATVHDERCVCTDPWPENPFCETEPEITYIGVEYHTWTWETIYDCTKCGFHYYEENFIDEPHSFYEGQINGRWYDICDVCGIAFAITD